MDYLDKMALVSKILLDQRVVELRGEVEKLRLALFWERHNSYVLNQAMMDRNYGIRRVCMCTTCLENRTYLYGLGQEDWQTVKKGGEGTVCKFKPYFMNLAEIIGITLHFWEPYQQIGFLHSSCLLYSSSFYDVDCHLVMDRDTCRCIGFGQRLYQCRNETDREMQRLNILLSCLRFEIDRPQ